MILIFSYKYMYLIFERDSKFQSHLNNNLPCARLCIRPLSSCIISIANCTFANEAYSEHSNTHTKIRNLSFHNIFVIKPIQISIRSVISPLGQKVLLRSLHLAAREYVIPNMQQSFKFTAVVCCYRNQFK